MYSSSMDESPLDEIPAPDPSQNEGARQASSLSVSGEMGRIEMEGLEEDINIDDDEAEFETDDLMMTEVRVMGRVGLSLALAPLSIITIIIILYASNRERGRSSAPPRAV